MRIAVTNWSRYRVGGAESYLARIVPELARAGCEIGFWCEVDGPLDREPIPLPEGAPVWCAAEMGTRRALDALREWKPDLLFSNGMVTPALDHAVADVAPGVFVAHGYHGPCISGTKTKKFPAPRPCERQFGLGCLAHYYPSRCGGLNPITMWEQFRVQSSRLEALRKYPVVVTASAHMQAEFRRNGFDPERVITIPYPIADVDGDQILEATWVRLSHLSAQPPGAAIRLLFIGRMDPLKGGATLLEALPRVVAATGRPVHLTFAGDGPHRARWERSAARLTAEHRSIEVEFSGWLRSDRLGELLDETDLLVIPSLWPEPFGLVGLEAGRHGVPAAAFRVGGIPDWLHDGVNGFLAPGDPPTAAGLADAMARCLESPDAHARLCAGALERSSAVAFRSATHVSTLLELFQRVVAGGRPSELAAAL